MTTTPAELSEQRLAQIRDTYPWGEPLVPADALTNEGRVIRELLQHIDSLRSRPGEGMREALEQIRREACSSSWEEIRTIADRALSTIPQGPEAACDTCKGFKVVNVDDWRQEPCPDCSAPVETARGEEGQDGCFGRTDLPQVMVYTARLVESGLDRPNMMSGRYHQMVMFGDHQRALDKAIAALSALKANAARYVWLRDRVFKDGGNLAIEIAGAYDNYVGGSMADGLDRAIDAEIVK